MTTKTKKAKANSAVPKIMVGSYVLVFTRENDSTQTGYVHSNGSQITTVLADAEEFTDAASASQAARGWLQDNPDDPGTIDVCRVEADGLVDVDEVFEANAQVSDTPIVQGELLPPDAGTTTITPSAGLQLNSPGAARMTALGLKAYASDLKAAAKNLRTLGKEKEAASCDADATVITETLLTQLEPQTKLPFGYTNVKAALSARISGKLRSQLAVAIKRDTPLIAGETDKDRQDKIKQKIDDFEEIIGNTASIVTALVEPVIAQAAEKGMLAGRLARETTADTLALEAIEQVSNA